MLVCSVSYCKETDLGFVSKFSTPRVSTCDFLLLEVCLFIFIASCDSKWHWLRRQIRHGCGSRLLLIVYVFAVLGLIELPVVSPIIFTHWGSLYGILGLGTYPHPQYASIWPYTRLLDESVARKKSRRE